MSRKQVKRLFERSLSPVGKKIFNTVQNHVRDNNCDICVFPHQVSKCTFMNRIKTELILPPNILSALYKEVFHIQFRERHSVFENKFLFLHIFAWLLESPELKISLSINGKFRDDEMLFTAVHGKKVQSLSVYENRITGAIQHFDMWKTFLYSLKNLQTLYLGSCPVKDSVFEAIGQHCEQIKKIDGVLIHKDMSIEALTKLCLFTCQNKLLKTKCCNTLEHFEIRNVKFQTTETETFQLTCNFVSILLENVQKLKFLGPYIHIDTYLRTLTPEKIIANSLEEIVIRSVTENLFRELKHFCPKMKKLKIIGECSGGISDLYKVVTTSVWSKLVDLHAAFPNCTIELSDFVKHLPVLEKLYITECEQVKWNGKTFFQYLNDVSLSINSHVGDISWILSFAYTVKMLEICLSEPIQQDSCQRLLTMPLPKLETLFIDSIIVCDFEFIKSLIKSCTSLTDLATCQLRNAEECSALRNFIKQNNYYCFVDLVSPPVEIGE